MSGADYTLVGMVIDAATGEVVRVIWPTEGDHELDDVTKTMFALDPARDFFLRKVPRDSDDALRAAGGITSGVPHRVE